MKRYRLVPEFEALNPTRFESQPYQPDTRTALSESQPYQPDTRTALSESQPYPPVIMTPPPIRVLMAASPPSNASIIGRGAQQARRDLAREPHQAHVKLINWLVSHPIRSQEGRLMKTQDLARVIQTGQQTMEWIRSIKLPYALRKVYGYIEKTAPGKAKGNDKKTAPGKAKGNDKKKKKKKKKKAGVGIKLHYE